MNGPYYVNTEARRKAAWGPPCQVPFAKVTLDTKTISVHRDTVSAWEAWEAIRAKHGYRLEGNDTGSYNCRHIANDPNRPWSAHAWATATDTNWHQNPDGKVLVTDMPKDMIRELQQLQTESGVYVFMWGGDWDRDPTSPHKYYDAMHWEVIAHPLDLATGIANIPTGPEKGDNMGLRAGMRGGGVKALQIHLNAWDPSFELVEDGIYGRGKTDPGRTGICVALYQKAAGFKENPLHADDTTLTHLYTNPLRNPETLKRLLERTP